MAIRTTVEAVQGVLMDEYGPRADGSNPDLAPFIRGANVMVNQVVRFASGRILSLMQSIGTDTTTLREIETWLAAHFYQQADPGYSSRSTGGASGSFLGQVTSGLEGTRFGQHALRLDYSGILSALDKRAVAGGAYLGKVPSEQIPYDERS